MTIHFKRTLPDHAHIYHGRSLSENSPGNPIYSELGLGST